MQAYRRDAVLLGIKNYLNYFFNLFFRSRDVIEKKHGAGNYVDKHR